MAEEVRREIAGEQGREKEISGQGRRRRGGWSGEDGTRGEKEGRVKRHFVHPGLLACK